MAVKIQHICFKPKGENMSDEATAAEDLETRFKEELSAYPQAKGNKEGVLPFCNKYKLTIKPEGRSHIYYRNLGYICQRYNKWNRYINIYRS